ncbi:MAG TPA: DinB family protein [Thermoanaerobaculia bacterium]|nr:DinB family protein [Thermoanaerobaculia bacterium]
MEIHDPAAFLDYYDKVRQRTDRVVACIPPERIEWTYREGKFTFGDLLRHLAALERWMFAENAQGRPSRYPGHGRELADGYDAVMSYFHRLRQESRDLFAQLGPEDLRKKCTTPAGAEITVWKWLRAMVEHEIHHRGQLYLYLSILGISGPPLYGLTSEEVRERSADE